MQLVTIMRFALAVSVSWPLFGAVARAQNYPIRPVTIIIGQAAGGIADVSTRIYATPLSSGLNQKVVVENRVGGSGTVAAVAIQNASPDGYTLLTIHGGQHFAIPIMQSVGYEPMKGFTPISLVLRLPSMLLVPYDSPARSVAELFDLGRKKAGGLSVGSSGIGSTAHLLAAVISRLTRTPMQFIQYSGAAPFMADLISDRLDFAFSSYSTARSNIEGKKLRALAIYSEARLPGAPDVPTLAEVGLGQVRVADWFGVVGPAGMPDAVITRLNTEIIKALRDKTVTERLAENGTVITTTSPQEMAAIMRDEQANMAQLLKELGLQSK